MSKGHKMLPNEAYDLKHLPKVHGHKGIGTPRRVYHLNLPEYWTGGPAVRISQGPQAGPPVHKVADRWTAVPMRSFQQKS